MLFDAKREVSGMEPMQSVSSLLIAGGLLTAGAFLVWTLMGFMALDRSTSLHRQVRLMGWLLTGWLLLQCMMQVAPDDLLYWLLLSLAAMMFFLSSHVWSLTAFTVSLHRPAPRSMERMSLLVNSTFALVLATNPIHGLMFRMTGRYSMDPGPFYFLVFLFVHITFAVGCGFIVWRLAQRGMNRHRFWMFLIALVVETALFFFAFVHDLVQHSAVLMFSLPTVHILSLVLLMQFMQWPAGERFLRFRLSSWDPGALAMAGTAVYIFNRQGRLVSVYGSLPGIPDAPHSFRDLLDRMEKAGMSGRGLAELGRMWLDGGETATGQVTAESTEECFDWVLHAFVHRPARKAVTRVLLFTDVTAKNRAEQENIQLEWQLAQLRQAIGSHNEVDREWAVAREANLTLRMLHGAAKDNFRDLKHRMAALSEAETDPTVRSWQLHDAALLTRKLLLQIRKGLSDVLLSDTRR